MVKRNQELNEQAMKMLHQKEKKSKNTSSSAANNPTVTNPGPHNEPNPQQTLPAP